VEKYGPPPKKEKKEKKAKAEGGAGKAAKKPKSGVKNALSAYIFFCNHKRAELKAKHPDMFTADLTKKLGEEWKKLSADAKKPFDEMAAKDKERVAALKAKA
jgi:structure-specific recognition protein 1